MNCVLLIEAEKSAYCSKKMSLADKDNRKNYHVHLCLHSDFASFKCKTNHAHKIKLETSQEIASAVEIEVGLK